MAKTKIDIKTEGASARIDHQPGQPIPNPYKPDSWQANAWSDGWRETDDILSGKQVVIEKLAGDKTIVHVATKDNLPRDVATGIAIPFPANMPEPTRQHIRCLEADLNFLAGNVDGSKLVRYAKKIEVLYARYQ